LEKGNANEKEKRIESRRNENSPILRDAASILISAFTISSTTNGSSASPALLEGRGGQGQGNGTDDFENSIFEIVEAVLTWKRRSSKRKVSSGLRWMMGMQA
jgi:hypothetical protein